MGPFNGRLIVCLWKKKSYSIFVFFTGAFCAWHSMINYTLNYSCKLLLSFVIFFIFQIKWHKPNCQMIYLVNLNAILICKFHLQTAWSEMDFACMRYGCVSTHGLQYCNDHTYNCCRKYTCKFRSLCMCARVCVFFVFKFRIFVLLYLIILSTAYFSAGKIPERR